MTGPPPDQRRDRIREDEQVVVDWAIGQRRMRRCRAVDGPTQQPHQVSPRGLRAYRQDRNAAGTGSLLDPTTPSDAAPQGNSGSPRRCARSDGLDGLARLTQPHPQHQIPRSGQRRHTQLGDDHVVDLSVGRV